MRLAAIGDCSEWAKAHPEHEVQSVSSVTDAFVAVASGRAEGVVARSLDLLPLPRLRDFPVLYSVEEPFITSPEARAAIEWVLRHTAEHRRKVVREGLAKAKANGRVLGRPRLCSGCQHPRSEHLQGGPCFNVNCTCVGYR
ncbi:MAG: hypothetical protein KGI89_03060 [Euryarchaeota archaeon]|nr:hypothetical protein [Euryarchaeota archaeon]